MRGWVMSMAVLILQGLAGCSNETAREDPQPTPVSSTTTLMVYVVNDRPADASFYNVGDTNSSLFSHDCGMITVLAHAAKLQTCSGRRPAVAMTDDLSSSPWHNAWMHIQSAWYRCPEDSCNQEAVGEAFSYREENVTTFEVRLTTGSPTPIVTWLQGGWWSSPGPTPAPSGSPAPIALGFRDETGYKRGIHVAVYPYKSAGKPALETWYGNNSDTYVTSQYEADFRATVTIGGHPSGGQLFSCVRSEAPNAKITYVLMKNPTASSGYRLIAERDGIAWRESPC